MINTSHFSLYLALLQSLALITTTAFILVQTPVANFLFNLNKSFRKQLLLGIFFGFISIAGTYLGEPVHGAIANIRDIGAISGGLFGGPFVGLIAGLIGGFHRYTLGGFTALPCMLATVINGTIAGFLYRTRKEEIFNPFKGMVFALGAETFHMILVLLIAKPYHSAIALINIIGGPMILANGIGVGLFLLVIKASFKEREFLSAITAEKVLKIAEKTLPVLSNGLTN
jgi:LytS/YehU family sensor histidine kinase